MKKWIIFIFFTAFITLATFVIYHQSNRSSVQTQQNADNLKILKINDSEIFVEIADSPQEQSQGLSGRQNLPQNQGLLFVFGEPQIPYFWMKEMLFALDFIWIIDNQIIALTENVQPQDYQPPKTLPMNQEVDMVLEVNQGTIKKLNIKIGDKIKFLN